MVKFWARGGQFWKKLKNHMDFQNSYVYLKGAESLGVLTGMLKYV